MVRAWLWTPKIWIGSPSAQARSWLSPVTMAQEKSRALLMTAERPARSSVLVISRTTPSTRLAITAVSTGSMVEDACSLICGTRFARGSTDAEDVIAGARDGRRCLREHDQGGCRLLDDGGADDLEARLQVARLIYRCRDRRGAAEVAGAGRRRGRRCRRADGHSWSRFRRQLDDQPGLPVDAFDRAADVAHGEDALVHLVKALDQGIDISLVAEARKRQRRFQLPDLGKRAGLGQELDVVRAFGARAQRGDEGLQLVFERRQGAIDAGEAEAVGGRDQARGLFLDDVGELHARGRQGRGDLGQDDTLAAQFLGDRQ